MSLTIRRTLCYFISYFCSIHLYCDTRNTDTQREIIERLFERKFTMSQLCQCVLLFTIGSPSDLFLTHYVTVDVVERNFADSHQEIICGTLLAVLRDTWVFGLFNCFALQKWFGPTEVHQETDVRALRQPTKYT